MMAYRAHAGGLLPADATTLGMVTNIVSLVLSAIALISSGIILFFFAEWSRTDRRKLRSRMLIGLFAIHFATGLLLLFFFSFDLAGRHPQTRTPLCTVSAIAIGAAHWAEYLWTVALAIVTYCVLLFPIARFTFCLKTYWDRVAIGLYLAAAFLGIGQSFIYETAYIGGLCYSHSTTSRLFNELSVFGPRCLVFVIISALYIHVYVHLRRTRKRRSKLQPLPPPPVLKQRVVTNRCNEARPGLFSRATFSRLASLLYMESGKGEAEEDETVAAGKSCEGVETIEPKAPPWEAIVLPDSDLLDGTPEQAASGTEVNWGNWSIGAPTPVQSTFNIPPPSPPHPKDAAPGFPAEADLDPLAYKGDVSRKDSPNSEIVSGPRTRFDSRESSLATTLVEPETDDSATMSDIDADEYDLPPQRPRPCIEVKREWVPAQTESVAEELARKASILFLLFPLSYMVITAVGVGRLVNALVSEDPNPWFHSVSRWSLFLQAPLDALTLYVASRYVGKRLRERNIA